MWSRLVFIIKLNRMQCYDLLLGYEKILVLYIQTIIINFMYKHFRKDNVALDLINIIREKNPNISDLKSE